MEHMKPYIVLIMFLKVAHLLTFYCKGENARKVKEGDKLIVKSDANGPLTTLVKLASTRG